MKLVFILTLTAFTACLSKEIHKHRCEKKFPQERETLQKEAYFRYIGKVKHGLDRVTVVNSIPIPKYSDMRKKPLHFNCAVDLTRKEAKTVSSYQYRVHEYCAKVLPYIRYMQNQEKSLVHGLRQLLIHDLYAALPELNPDSFMQDDEPAESQPLSSEDEKEVKREKRGIGAIFTSVLTGLITLDVESLTSWIKDKQQRRINKAIDTMRKTESEVKNTLSQYQDDFLMFGKYSVQSLKSVIDTLNSLHDKQTELEKLVTTKLFTEVSMQVMHWTIQLKCNFS